MLSKPSWVHHLLRHPKNTKGTTQQGLNFKNVKFKNRIIIIKKNSYHEVCVYTNPPGYEMIKRNSGSDRGKFGQDQGSRW